MTLLDEARGQRSRPGPECTFAKLRRSNPQLHAELLEALEEAPHVVTYARIERLLFERGVEIGKDTLSRHKNRQCMTCRS